MNTQVLTKRFLAMSVVLMLLLSRFSSAAIVNNNHLFQTTERVQQQLLALRQHQQLPELLAEAPIYADKLAIHLAFKTQQLIELAADLQVQHGLQADEIPNIDYRVMRPRNVMPYLEQLSQQLDAVLKKLAIPLPAAAERPLGKSVNDVYQQLVRIELLCDGLIERDAELSLNRNMQQIKQDLLLVSKVSQRPLQFVSVTKISGRAMSDVNILLFQSIYLLERLLRQLEVEPSKPGRLPVGESSTYQVVDSSVILKAELHRLKTKLQIEQDSQVKETERFADANQAYAQALSLRDGLLMMLGEPAL